MTDIDKRNEERKQAVFRLLTHKDLGIMLGLALIFLGLSVWSYLFVVLFLFCLMEWHDMNGYKFLACTGNTYLDYYEERDVENVMAYKIDNFIFGLILLLFTESLVYFWYGLPQVIYVFAITLLWFFAGVKEVFFYNPVDKDFLNNKDIWWYSFTFLGFIKYKLLKKTMSGKEAVWQAFIGILVSIGLTIYWVLYWKILLENWLILENIIKK